MQPSRFHTSLLAGACLSVVACVPAAAQQATPDAASRAKSPALKQVAAFEHRVTGVTMSEDGASS
jgi:hypothetical protein